MILIDFFVRISQSVKNKKISKNTDVSNLSSSLFMSSAISMSWQLAVTVLVPLFVGVFIDEHFKTSPLWTLIGLLVGILMGIIVVWKAVMNINQVAGKNNLKIKNE